MSVAAAEPSVDPRMRAFRELYRGEFAFVWAAARRFGVPPGTVEDAVQDVFLTAYRRLDQLHFEVSARAWLHGVTRRVAARYRRSADRLHRRLAAVAAVPRGSGEPPQERVATALQLEQALARLGERTRAAFEMSELLGMSGPEIAGELGIPVATVYSRVRLAREQLLRELGAPQLERGLATARERDVPPREAAQRSWLVLLPGLTPASAGAGLGMVASARSLFIGTLLLAAGTVAVAWPRERVAVVQPVVQREPVAARPAVDAAAPVVTESPTPAPVVAPAPVVSKGSAEDRLAAEVAVIDLARAELGRGEVAAARARLAEHARRFPDGALADLRAATEVELLCREERTAEAEVRAAALVAEHPRSAVAQRFANFSCRR
jgi:RNA polymerase sigma factor (sigma-70 family)